jgi:capsid protein
MLVVRGKYDAAQTTHENRRHWANADHLSANAAVGADVRRILRSRARYEVANNSYAKGIVLTLANYVVGTGPLQPPNRG